MLRVSQSLLSSSLSSYIYSSSDSKPQPSFTSTVPDDCVERGTSVWREGGSHHCNHDHHLYTSSGSGKPRSLDSGYTKLQVGRPFRRALAEAGAGAGPPTNGTVHNRLWCKLITTPTCELLISEGWMICFKRSTLSMVKLSLVAFPSLGTSVVGPRNFFFLF